LLGLPPELGLGKRHLDRSDEALLDIVLDRFVLVFLLEFGELAIVFQNDVVDDSGERLVEPGLVSATLARGDRVDERCDLGVVATGPAQGNVDSALAFDIGHLAVDRHLLGEGVDP